MSKRKIPELKIEIVHSGANLIYLSLIEYKREQYLGIIDNIKCDELGIYILDFAEQENINIKEFLSHATFWFYSQSDKIPLSIYLAKNGLTEWVQPIFRNLDTTYISRIIGHAFSFNPENKSKVKRRKVIPISDSIEIKFSKKSS